jgi:uncharacterized protein with HEPN domain
MYSKLIVLHILGLIRDSLQQIDERSSVITESNDFLISSDGVMRLDSICMKLTAIGESLKNLDKITNKELLAQYPEIQWKRVMGIRDIVVHHYFDVDADEIFRLCKEDIPQLYAVLEKMISDLKS